MSKPRIINRVELILKNHQMYRDSDKRLLIAFWATEGLHLSDTQIEKFLKCTSAESITRARRYLAPKYPPGKDVDDGRFDRYEQYKDGGAAYL